MLIRPLGMSPMVGAAAVSPGDILGGGESLTAGAITTVGAGTWTAAAIATGIIRRTGPVAGYVDTVDSATNILAALGGNPNSPGACVTPGTSFRVLFLNTVAFAMTNALTAGSGMIAGTGNLDCAASLWREYLFTVINATPQATVNSNTTNASPTVTFNPQPGQTTIPQGTVTPGMVVSGTGITAGTTVIGVTNGVGGITGVTLSANATATSVGGVALTFVPQIRMDAIRGGTA